MAPEAGNEAMAPEPGNEVMAPEPGSSISWSGPSVGGAADVPRARGRPDTDRLWVAIQETSPAPADAPILAVEERAGAWKVVDVLVLVP